MGSIKSPSDGGIMEYYHVDVFTSEPLKGNGLTVVFVDSGIDDSSLLKITQEFRQFETIFIYPKEEDVYPARIFTVEEELDFAGHPVIGAAAVLFEKHNEHASNVIKFKINNRIISTTVRKEKDVCRVSMNQGKASFISALDISEASEIIESLSLAEDDVAADCPIEIISTGLSYLLLPLKDREALSKSRINVSDFEAQLENVGAKFVYVFDPETLECRTWDNFGMVEDVATGSAAGPLCAYLVKNNFRNIGENIIIKQGSYAGRPSSIEAVVEADTEDVIIRGDVSFFARGHILN